MVESRLEDLSPVVKKLSVELKADRVRDALDAAFTGLTRTVRLKGYRAGHVPRRLVERYYGDEVRKDVAQKLVASSIFQVLQEHKLTPVAEPRVENGDVVPDQPFKYVATVEVKPRIEPKDYVGLSVPKLAVEVTDAEVEERLQDLREGRASMVPVEGRDSVEAGDFVLTDYEGFVDGAPLRGAKKEGTLLEAVPGSMLENKAEGLVGAKVGETRELTANFPADYSVADLRGKDAKFTITVRGLKRREVPALDDAFAQELGGESKTLAELREAIRKDLTESKRETAQAEQREKLFAALLAKNPIEAPPALVERNVDNMLRNMVQSFFRQGIDPRKLGFDFEGMREEMRQRALTDVRAHLVLEAIAEKENLQAADAEMEAHYAKVAQEVGQPIEAVREAFRREEAVEGLKGKLRQDKALAFLLERAHLE